MFEICVLCLRYGINNIHVGSNPERTAAESDRRGDGDDHGYLPQCGPGQGKTTEKLSWDVRNVDVNGRANQVRESILPQFCQTQLEKQDIVPLCICFLCRRTVWTSRSLTVRPQPLLTCAAWRPTWTPLAWMRLLATASAKPRRATRSRPYWNGPKMPVRIQRWRGVKCRTSEIQIV